MIAGECGVPDDAPPEALGALTHFAYNAEQYGYDAAFLWRLENVLIDAKQPARPLTEMGREMKKLLLARR